MSKVDVFFRSIIIALGICMMILMIIMLFLVLRGGVDFILSTDDDGHLPIVGENEIPCIDKWNREFKDEICIEEITCSKYGWAGNKKCVLGGLSE